jgi:hypothetical protein
MTSPTNETDRFDQPLYDATKPLACTIQAAELPDHIALIERLRSNLESVERTPHGVLLRLPDTAENAADLHRFAVEEQQCCEFWGFAVIEQPQPTLRWDGPPELAGYMDLLVDYFQGRAPIGSLLGGFTAESGS